MNDVKIAQCYSGEQIYDKCPWCKSQIAKGEYYYIVAKGMNPPGLEYYHFCSVKCLFEFITEYWKLNEECDNKRYKKRFIAGIKW